VSFIPFSGIKIQVRHLLKNPLSHLEYPLSIFLFDFRRVHTLALTNNSLRFFPLLYATTEGVGKILLSLGSSSAITCQCFLTIFEMEGRLGWNFCHKRCFLIFNFIHFFKGLFSINFSDFFKGFIYDFWVVVS
jgi:hypothetical protein